MTTRFRIRLLGAATALAAASLLSTLSVAPALAQTFPAKSVRAVLPYSAGSGPDAVVRTVGEKVGREWGQTLVVDNKPGANGWLAIGEVKRAAAIRSPTVRQGDSVGTTMKKLVV